MNQWGIFSLSQIPDQKTRVETFDPDLRQFELAERLGYDKVWIAEHLFSNYDPAHCERAMRLAAERVLPYV